MRRSRFNLSSGDEGKKVQVARVQVGDKEVQVGQRWYKSETRTIKGAIFIMSSKFNFVS